MKALLLFLSVLTITLIVYFFVPSGSSYQSEVLMEDELADSTKGNEAESQAETIEDAAAIKAEEELRAKRVATYEDLEKSRRNLERSLSRLKASLWNVRMPPDEAEEINKEMMSAYSLLKNKKLMGAFTSFEQMEDELKKVKYYHEKAKEITERVKSLPKKES